MASTDTPWTSRSQDSESWTINGRQLLLGTVFLITGVLEYLVCRPIGSVELQAFAGPITNWLHRLPSLYGRLGVIAPDFFHALALPLLSMSVLSKRRSRILVCIMWFSVDSAFELGQKYGKSLAGVFPEWLEKIPVIGNLGNYFANGTFDPWDLVAIGIGSLVAISFGELTSKRKGGTYEKGRSGQGNLEKAGVACH